MMKPLAGIRVLDFTNAVAGPTATSILGDFGADVIKIEGPETRNPKPPGAAPLKPGAADEPYNRVTHFNDLNRSKRSVVLDLRRAEGQVLFLELAKVSDAVVENFSPRVMANLGLDYPDLCRVRPDIILVSMPAFGKSGPYRDRISYGPGIDAMSGLSHLTGYEDGPPSKPGNFYCDQNAAQLAALSLLAAVRHRHRTGEGQYVECAMIEGELQVVAEALLDAQMNGRVQTRTGNRHPWLAPHGVYPAGDRTQGPGSGGEENDRIDQGTSGSTQQVASDDDWIAIAVQTDAQFAALCHELGQPELASDPRFAGALARHANQDALDAIIAAWTRGQQKHALQRRLQAVGVPAGAVLNVRELLEDEHVQARDLFQTVTYPDLARPFPHTRVAFKLRGRHASRIDTPAPRFGGANHAVLHDLLGLSEQRLAALAADRITAETPAAPHGTRA
ncbi:MAG TPA: CoA transferase [Dehalococcoidia bacterium]|jgi:crotonobetainyl-CoA:carnitine CoA-transferase CaiB-like acyl-CoA transferase